jgi:hypothetical protein
LRIDHVASTSQAELPRWFKTTVPLPNVQQRYEAAPTQMLPIVLRDHESGHRRLEGLRWGLIPFLAKDAKIRSSTTNAKAETVATRATIPPGSARRPRPATSHSRACDRPQPSGWRLTRSGPGSAMSGTTTQRRSPD